MEKIAIIFYTLTGKFSTSHQAEFDTEAAAMEAVKAHAASGGYTNVSTVSDDGYGWRYTARTPGGRGGRNIAATAF